MKTLMQLCISAGDVQESWKCSKTSQICAMAAKLPTQKTGVLDKANKTVAKTTYRF